MKNNKGFSLIELIIVIAILTVITSASVVGFGYLYKTNVKSCVKKLNGALIKTQSYTTAKSAGNKDIGMKLTCDADGYCVEYKGIATLGKEVIASKKVKIRYKDASGNVLGYVDASHPLEIYFDRSTGGLLPQDTSGNYIKVIEITNASSFDDSGTCPSITISKLTGKTEISVD